MFIEKLLNQTSAPLLEQVVRFAAARHRVIAENIVNADTPGYVQKDLSVDGFRRMIVERIEQRRAAAPGSIGFDGLNFEQQHSSRGILFHDRNNRSMEQLMSDQAANAMLHNLAVELLRKQFQSMEMALRERVG